MRGVLPARNLRDQPGLYRSEEVCGAFDTTGFGFATGSDMSVLVVSELGWDEEPALCDVFGAAAFGVSAILVSSEVVDAFSPSTIAELVEGILEEDASASGLVVRGESAAVA